MNAAVDGRVGAVIEETAAARPGAGALLRDLDQAPPSELVDVCSSWLARHVAAQACVLLLADYAELVWNRSRVARPSRISARRT